MNAEQLILTNECELLRTTLQWVRGMAEVEANFGSESWKKAIVTIDRCLAVTAHPSVAGNTTSLTL